MFKYLSKLHKRRGGGKRRGKEKKRAAAKTQLIARGGYARDPHAFATATLKSKLSKHNPQEDLLLFHYFVLGLLPLSLRNWG